MSWTKCLEIVCLNSQRILYTTANRFWAIVGKGKILECIMGFSGRISLLAGVLFNSEPLIIKMKVLYAHIKTLVNIAIKHQLYIIILFY